jgi:hypothetical protein
MGEARRTADAIEACVDKGVTERPFVAGQTYFGFAVHRVVSLSRSSPDVLAFVIAHTDHRGGKYTQDLIREDISVDACCELLKAYGIGEVTGAVTEGDGFDLAHAALGAIHLAATRDPLRFH